MPNEHEWYVAGDLTTASAWAGIARTYCAKLPADTALAALIARFIDTHPEEITQALDPEHAEAEKDEATGFLLFAIRQAVIDHALSDGEVRAIRHVGRLLRVQEASYYCTAKAKCERSSGGSSSDYSPTRGSTWRRPYTRCGFKRSWAWATTSSLP